MPGNEDVCEARRDLMKLLSASAAGCAAFAAPVSAAAGNNDGERYNRGIQTLKKVGGEGFDRPLNVISELSPDFADLLVRHAYGDVVGRPQLDLITREAVTVASLMALGNYDLPIKYHLNGYLNVGGKPEVLVELCFLAIALLGFPAAIKTTGLVRSVLKGRNITMAPIPSATDDGKDRYLIGARQMIASTENGISDLEELSKVSPTYAKLLVSFAHGEILTRDGLDARTKSLAMLSMLSTIGNVRGWIRDATLQGLRQGVSRQDIVEAMIQLTVYGGYPAAIVGFFQVKEVFDAIDSGALPLDPREASVATVELETRETRFTRGAGTMSQTSAAAGEKVVSSFADLAPDIGKQIMEHAYGDIFSRPGLEPGKRELTAIAAMASSGSLTAETPLKVHVNAGITAGLSRMEIEEALLNLVPYVGYPKIQRAMQLAMEVFEARNL